MATELQGEFIYWLYAGGLEEQVDDRAAVRFLNDKHGRVTGRAKAGRKGAAGGILERMHRAGYLELGPRGWNECAQLTEKAKAFHEGQLLGEHSGGHDDRLTLEELDAVKSLERLAKKWPRSLMLVSAASSLVVVHTDDLSDDFASRVLSSISGIPNDGGDPW